MFQTKHTFYDLSKCKSTLPVDANDYLIIVKGTPYASLANAAFTNHNAKVEYNGCLRVRSWDKNFVDEIIRFMNQGCNNKVITEYISTVEKVTYEKLNAAQIQFERIRQKYKQDPVRKIKGKFVKTINCTEYEGCVKVDDTLQIASYNCKETKESDTWIPGVGWESL